MVRRILRRVIRGKSEAVRSPPVAVAPPPNPEPAPVDEPEEPMVEIETEQLREWLGDGEPLVLLDIREAHELRSGFAEGALRIRMNDVPQSVDELPEKSARLVVYCAAGARSFGVTHWLREQGWTDAWSLVSGFSGTVDAGVPVAKPE